MTLQFHELLVLYFIINSLFPDRYTLLTITLESDHVKVKADHAGHFVSSLTKTSVCIKSASLKTDQERSIFDAK